jgi:Ca2+-transporting ATPase
MIVLLAIGGLSLLFGKTVEAVVMVFVVVAYIAVEFINKYRSDRTMTQLRNLASPISRVIRNGKIQDIEIKDVVCGDIIILAAGVRVPADARLLESFGLSVNEASLTGESFPVDKSVSVIMEMILPLAERRNMVFAGTMVQSGEGKALVIAVGGLSELGKIASEVSRKDKEKTILQEAMTRLTKFLAVFAIVVSLLIPAVGFFHGQSIQEMIVTWLALTFLMIPGQPPVIITMSLALASFKLAKINLVVKRLHGVEALSQVTAIVTDKTGTITENRMQAASFILPTGEEVPPEKLTTSLRNAILHALPRYGNDPTDEAVHKAIADSSKIETPSGSEG